MLFDLPPADPLGSGPVTAREARRSIDDLVTEARRYRSSAAYAELLRFVGGFRRYAPFNALLIHSQRSGARFVAPAHKWREKYGRRVKPGEQALVALQPFGPVMFVYDVSQTEPDPGAAQLPGQVINPFAMPVMTNVEPALDRLVENAKFDGVRVSFVGSGSQSAGCIRTVQAGLNQRVQAKRRPPEWLDVPVRYETEVNQAFTATERYATVAHELGHLYSGHLGTPNPKWWPNRRHVSPVVEEFEAESIAFLAYQRVDESATMPPHLAQYLREESDVPDGVSLETIMTAAGRVIEMSEKLVGARKARD